MARRSRRGRRRQNERSFEAATYALIIALFLLAALFPQLRADFVALAGGAILVGSAIYQFNRRWRVNLTTWIGGLLLLGIGVLSIQGGTGVPLGMLLPLVIIAGVIGISLVTGNL
jgi:hypothetical protein